jgi:hypothetical protein
MRDIELSPIPSAIPDPAVDDAAYAEPPPGGIASDTAAVDPAASDTKAYSKVSLGGEFGPARAPLLSQPADGGVANLLAATTIIVTPPVVPTPPHTWPGRAANNTSFLNLYPWHKTPPQGLDQNNPNPPPAADPPPPPLPTGVTVGGNTLVGNNGNATFSGPASRDAIVTLMYAIDGGPSQQLFVGIQAGDTGSQIAAKVRNAVDAVVGLDADGTGGSVHVIGIGGNLTAFNLSVS